MGKGPTWTGMGRGCGPFKFSEVSGSRGLSNSKGALKSGQGKMSTTHGAHGGSKSNNMNQNVGNSVGHGCRTFSNKQMVTPGGQKGGPAHAKQPSGHKSNNGPKP